MLFKTGLFKYSRDSHSLALGLRVLWLLLSMIGCSSFVVMVISVCWGMIVFFSVFSIVLYKSQLGKGLGAILCVRGMMLFGSLLLVVSFLDIAVSLLLCLNGSLSLVKIVEVGCLAKCVVPSLKITSLDLKTAPVLLSSNLYLSWPK